MRGAIKRCHLRQMTMNAEVTAVVENDKSEEKGEESCTECLFMELGQVSEETKGGWWGGYDQGIGKHWGGLDQGIGKHPT